MRQKNECINLYITDLTEDGEGIGKDGSYPFFVQGAVPGDRIRAKVMKCLKNYGYARIEEITEASPDRTEPPCPVFGPCGGCSVQSMSYEAQAAWKNRKIQSALQRIGGFSTEEIHMLPFAAAEKPFRYRNKSVTPVGLDKEGRVILGYYAKRSHRIVPETNCLLSPEVSRRILEEIRDFLTKEKISVYDEEAHKGLVRSVLIRSTEEGDRAMVFLVCTKNRIPKEEELIRRMRQHREVLSLGINVQKEKTNVLLGRENRMLYGEPFLPMSLGDVDYDVSPTSFFQIHASQAERLYGSIREDLLKKAEETGRRLDLVDLYCGTGSIGLFLAGALRSLIGIEIHEAAVRDARVNAKRNGIENAEFHAGAAEEVFPRLQKDGRNIDALVLDPPRKGCEESLLRFLRTLPLKNLYYVSCNPATLARDLRILTEKGEGAYSVDSVQGYDFFPQTTSVETLVFLSRV